MGRMKKTGFVCTVIVLAIVGGMICRRLILHEKYQNEQIEMLLAQTAENETQIEELKTEIYRLNQITTLLDDADSIYQKLKAGHYVNILIVGDSIGEGTGASGIEQRWFTLLINWMRETYGVDCTVTNISMGGNTSYAGYAREMILEDGIEYDLAIICYGENDKAEELSLNYEAIIRGIRGKYKECSVISILESSQKTYTDKILEIEKLAAYYRIPVADMIKAFQKSGYAYEELAEDGIHPGDLGQRIYFETIRDVILEQIAQNISIDKTELKPINEDVVKYEHFKYFPVEQFTRTDKFTWVIQTDQIRGELGVYRRYDPGKCTLRIFVDDALFEEEESDWQYEFSQYYFSKMSENTCAANRNIKLVFASQEQADGFEGLLFTGVQ